MDDYAAQLNMARAQDERQRRQEEEIEEVTRATGKPASKQNILPSLIGIALVALGVELVPFGDLLPSFIGAVVATAIRLKKAGRSINPVSFSFAGMLAAVADFSDWLIIGSIPLVGDIFDGMMGMFLSFWAWYQAHSS
jgi:hypothetical protein